MEQRFFFSQMFGEPSISTAVTESDSLSAVEFDKQGDHIAVGDKTGRIIIFKRFSEVEENENEFNYLCEFQAHETEFDYLRSQEIEEKVNKHLSLLSTNDHTIKLWKIKAESLFSSNSFKNIKGGQESEEEWKSRSKNCVKIPISKKQQGEFKATIRRSFVEGHEFNIHTISPCEDGIHFISADDLKINLWNLERKDVTYNIIDIKPNKMEELGEVITCANFHPSDSSIFVYGGSSGTTRVIDLRISSQGERNSAYEFLDKPDPAKRNFFTDIVNTLSDVKFSLDGKFVYTRDYLTVKVWDLSNPSVPFNTIEVQEEMKRHMCELYEEEKVLEKFELASGTGPLFVTGGYSSSIMLIGRDGVKSQMIARHDSPMDVLPRATDEWDSTRSVQRISWHTKRNCIAAGVNNCLFIYNSD